MISMEDDLSKLGVIPSDRKKLEHMGITTLEQIAVMSVQTLGMGASKGKQLIQRARNIIANDNITDVNIKDDDTVEITVRSVDRAVKKSVLNTFDVYAAGWGNASLEIDDSTLILKRNSSKFDLVLGKAQALKEIIETKKLDEQERFGIFLPEEDLKEFAKKRGFDGFGHLERIGLHDELLCPLPGRPNAGEDE